MTGRDTQTGSPGERERYTDRFTRLEGELHRQVLQVRGRDIQTYRQVHQVRGRDTQTGSSGERERDTDRFTR